MDCWNGNLTSSSLGHQDNHQLYMNATRQRRDCILPNELPYQGWDWRQTTTVPQPYEGGGSGWAKLIDLESNLRTFENRRTGDDCNDLRSLQVPLAWSMDYLPHQIQQDDDFARHREFSRMMIADTCRPLPQDNIGYYDSRNCRSHITDCKSGYPVDAVYQHRLVYP